MNNIETNQTSAIARVKHLQTVLEHFKKRFYVKYFLSLREKHSYVKSRTSSKCYLMEGDIVLTKENNSTPRLSWKKGVIEKLIFENDKNVRGASFRTKYGKSTKMVVINRSLQLRMPLELSTSENVESSEKDKNESLHSVSEIHCDITSDESIENRRLKRLAARIENIM